MNFKFKPYDKRVIEFGTGKYPLNLYGDNVIEGLLTATAIGKHIAETPYKPLPQLLDGYALATAIEPWHNMIRQLQDAPKWLPGLEQEESSMVIRQRKHLELSLRLAIVNYASRDMLREMLETDCARIIALSIDEEQDLQLSLIRKEAIIDFVLLRHSPYRDYFHAVNNFTPSPNALLVIKLIDEMVALKDVGFNRTPAEIAFAAENKDNDVALLLDHVIAELIKLDPTLTKPL